jgi:hypothetical protein
MKRHSPKPQLPDDLQKDDLLRLEMLVARRADKLSEEAGNAPGHDLENWLQAEREVFEQHDACNGDLVHA